MPFFVNVQRRMVVERTDRGPRLGEFVVDGETARACRIVDGQELSEQQVQALRDGSPSAFRVAVEASGGRLEDYPAPAASALPRSTGARSEGAGKRAVAAAAFAEVFAWISGGLGLVLGLLIALQEESNGWETSRPYVELGIGLALASVFQASLLIMVAAYIQWRIKDRRD